MRLFDIFKKKTPPPPPEPKKIRYPFTEWVTFGEDVDFIDEKTWVRKPIVKDRVIVNFPGFDEEDKAKWICKWVSGEKPKNDIRFRTEFSRCAEDEYVMLWEIQPDGRYWGDSNGFGMEHDLEIVLYSKINKKGNFTMPFKLYELGIKRYFEYKTYRGREDNL